MKILVIGASARAAAQSARRAGHEVAALDLFVDRDLCEIAECETIRQYPVSIVDQAKRWPDHSIMLCGGMENFPELVSQLEQKHEIIGPNAIQIQALRSLENWQSWVANFASEDWLRFPMTRSVGKIENLQLNLLSNVATEAWLWKSHTGAGGMHVFNAKSLENEVRSQGYLQRYISGQVLGVTFCCTPDRTSILAVMRNINRSESSLGEILEPNESPFLYAGSNGPVVFNSVIERRLSEWVHRIALSIRYRGILQADYILGDDGYLYLLEFNPRWTASMELVEICTGKNLINEQLCVQFQHVLTAETQTERAETLEIQTQKWILYAAREMMISATRSDAMMARSIWLAAPWDRMRSISGWADIPNAGTKIAVGTPIATLLAIRCELKLKANLVPAHEMLASTHPWPEIDKLRTKLDAD